MTDSTEQTDKRHKIIAFGLMALSTLLWLIALAIPFLDYSLTDSAWIIATLIVVAEVLFYIAIWVLGKKLWHKYKSQIMVKLQQLKDDASSK
ncbi:transporter suffix domain-containing protein [Thiomicrorhabdus sediminis]|uniref:Transporter suffix domain-containing protein n=1 Tax=Thiomicrorhabdus sediminis TaxID=2580412 RepID=A0A4P9K4X8_9GAMM|nr:transporter suffix domain-containing protein [Thiomicrorhabdus sediminis]QCU90012.1 transporter suffix domain-containing protein [Thiomicrorhabdus sediminis]